MQILQLRSTSHADFMHQMPPNIKEHYSLLYIKGIEMEKIKNRPNPEINIKLSRTIENDDN